LQPPVAEDPVIHRAAAQTDTAARVPTTTKDVSMANANANTNAQPEATGVTTTPEPFVAPVRITSAPTLDGTPTAEPLYPPEGPDPKGTTPGAVEEMERESATSRPEGGVGIEGEEVVWEGAYSLRNFIGRVALRALLTVGWIVLAIFTWGYGYEDLLPVTLIGAAVLIFAWGTLLYRVAQARYGHAYQLTNRRLFVSTGLLRRRQDQMELLRVKDVYIRQKLLERWMSLGTVVVVSSEKEIPVFYVAGVDDPKQVMDLIWHHARAERDLRSTKIDSV
jgi:membrane protein YdbS with pleckstrin-like domain